MDRLQHHTLFAEETAVDIIKALLKVFPGAAKEKTGRESFLFALGLRRASLSTSRSTASSIVS